MLEECLGGDDPHARLARGFHERRYPGLVEHTREVQAEHLRAGRPLTRERFDVAVDVIDGGVPGLQRAHEADVEWHVPREADAGGVGGGGHRIEHVPLHPGMDLQEVIPSRLLILHHPHRDLDARRAGTVEGRARGVDPGAEDLPSIGAVPQGQVLRGAEHAADRADPVDGVQREHALHLRLGGVPRRDVRVHLGECRDEELAAAVDPPCTRRHRHRCGGPERLDAIATDDHRQIRLRALTVHGDDGDVDDGERRGLLRDRRCRHCDHPQE